MLGLNLSLGLGSLDWRTLQQRAFAAIRRAGGTVLLSGLPRNYFDSVGTTTAQVDQPVGLVLDGMGVLGAELVSNGDFSAGETGWTKAATVTISGGVATFPGTTLANALYQNAGITAGKTYAFTFTFTGSGSATYGFGGGSNGTVNVVAGANSAVLTATAGSNGNIAFSTTTLAGTIDNISVRELTGNHATQATTGSKPTLRRGLVNQLLYSQWGGGGTAPTGWTAFGGGGVEGALLPSGMRQRVFTSTASRDFIYSSANLAANSVYTVAVYVDANPNNISASNLLGQGALPAGASLSFPDVAPAAGSFILATLTVGATAGSITLRVGLGTSSNITGSVTLSAPALYQGTVTAQQILAAGGIPLTTTAPASSALGNYWWQFAPTAPSDSFNTAITTGNEGWVCAGVTPGVTATGHHIFGNGATGAADVGVWVRIPSTNNNVTLLASNGTTREIVVASTSAFTGAPVVVDGGWTASIAIAAVNGVETSIAKTVNCTTTKSCTIGGNASSGWYLNGSMPAIVICPTLPPAADRALIRAWVAKQQGQTL